MLLPRAFQPPSRHPPHFVHRLGGEFMAGQIDDAQILRQPRQIPDAVHFRTAAPSDPALRV